MNRTFKYQKTIIFLGAAVIVLLATIYWILPLMPHEQAEQIVEAEYTPVVPDPVYNQDYSIAQLTDSEQDREIRYGYDLFMKTSEFLGPLNPNLEEPYTGNVLSCNNCHLLGGTKPYGAPLIGIIQRFPQYRGREDQIGTIEERVNGCMERSMNGRRIDPEGKDMKAFVAYMEWLGRFAPDDGKIAGLGFPEMELPERAVDLEHGARVFSKHCIECHFADGQGQLKADSTGYLYPPLWGQHSYNNGAGMTRVITAARFIKGNMPYGTTYDQPMLTDEEAYDVAGYINQHGRPVKHNLGADYPNMRKKPVSTPYPPYDDPFPIEQHQMGPFQEIMAYYKAEYGIVKTK